VPKGSQICEIFDIRGIEKEQQRIKEKKKQRKK